MVRHHQDAIITAQPQSAVHEVFSLVGVDERGRARFLHNGAAAYRID
ncbi:MAG TPA: hypothetical protein VN408_02420 [Actinoplanes sp.]|nr:hypothetical protein [Actinoplanes sp.]